MARRASSRAGIVSNVETRIARVKEGATSNRRRARGGGILLAVLVATLAAFAEDRRASAGERAPAFAERCPKGGRNLVVNGDFESTPGRAPYQTLSAGAAMGAWGVVAGAVDLIDSSFWSPAEGRQSLDLDGSCGAGAIGQVVAADPGRSYLLCYALSGNPGGPPAVKTLEVWWGGVLVDSVAFDASAASYRHMTWVYRRVTVTAASRFVPLEFRSLTEGCYGPALDEISLYELKPPLP